MGCKSLFKSEMVKYKNSSRTKSLCAVCVQKAAEESLGAPGREQSGESSRSVRSPRTFFGCPLELFVLVSVP